jgi:cyclophilin family peptidyl-prolyl cis-trans isomerase
MVIGAIALMAVLAIAVMFWPRSLGAVTVVKVVTDKGEFTMNLYGERMPITVANFVKLAEEGFYDGLKFHRVEDWVVQGGDPAGDGTGGPGYTIQFETYRWLRHDRGAIGMARRADDRNSAGSQFYIVKEEAQSLNREYAIFGKVVDGMDVVDKLVANDKIVSVTVVSKP